MVRTGGLARLWSKASVRGAGRGGSCCGVVVLVPTAMNDSLVTPLCDELLDTSAGLASVMRQVADPTVSAVGVWSIGETAAHVSGSSRYFLAAARGASSLERLDEVDQSNAHALADDPERDPSRPAERLETCEQALVGFARQVDGDPAVHPFAGVEVPLSSLLAIELGELLVHGFDIARAAHLPWSIDPAAARLALQGYLPLMPYTLDVSRAHGVRLALEIRIRGMQAVVVTIADDALVVHASGEQRVDAHIAATPTAYLLLMWNRIPPWRPLLSGQLLIWGRRPWRALELGRLTHE
jgi:uncharacterized protein (TIGR03083 family)